MHVRKENRSANSVSWSAQACGLSVGRHEFAVLLRDGRRIAVPFACFPRLAGATPAQRQHFEVYANGKMLHWPDLDEDIEVQHLVEGRLPIKQVEPSFTDT